MTRLAKTTPAGLGIATLAIAALALLIPARAHALGAPIVSTTGFSQITESSALLEANLNPNGKKTEYRFEYVSQADFEAEGFTAAVDTPPQELPVGSSDVTVSAPLGGLSPGTSYRFRLFSRNSFSPPSGTIGPERAFATYDAQPSFGPCPNDVFRLGRPSAALPDCRAYEQASPVDKNGGDVTGTVPFVKASIDGDAVTFLSSSGIPGGEGEQELPVYLASRGEGAWSTQGLLPPGDSGQGARVMGWTPDFSQVFDMALKLERPLMSTFLSRSSASGQLTTISDYTPDARYFFAGASADGSKVIFEATAKLPSVSAALEGKPNLYLWDRANDTLSLAGVLNDGNAPPAGAIAGAYDWIHGTTPAALSEGGSAIEYYTQDQQAVSADGSVYFTEAGTGQLYLRRNPTKAQSPLDIKGKCTDPALACTIQVSATQKENGTGPLGADAAGTRPATFMAATLDGSKAFFTSAEKLTDDATTGPEPAPPAIARADIGGAPASVDPDFLPAVAAGIAVDDEYIYWANPAKGTIGRAKLDGTGANEEFIAAAGSPQYVAVDDEYVYWTNAADGEDGNGTIGRAKLDGSEPKLDFITGANDPRGVAVDSEHVYWGQDYQPPPEGGQTFPRRGAIGRANLGGTGVEQVFIDGLTHELVEGVAVNASHVFWAGNTPGGYVSRADIDGTNSTFMFISPTSNLRGVALDAGHVYWAAQGDEAIGRANLELEEVEKEFIKADGSLKGLAVDAAHVYWSANSEVPVNPGNDLYRYDAATGDLTDLVPDSEDANGAEVRGVLGTSDDGSYVYFVANGDLDGAGDAVTGNCPGGALGGGLTGSCNLYLWHQGQISFIARLDPSGAEFTSDIANWVPSPTRLFPSPQYQNTARVSPDGRTLLFRSQLPLSAYDNEGEVELYRYRAGDPEPLVCVSCNPTGAAQTLAPESHPSLGTIYPPVYAPERPASVLSRVLSEDGDRVFFETADKLVAADTNGDKECKAVGSFDQGEFPACQDVYEWEAEGAGSCETPGGCFYLLSSGKGTEPAFLLDASASGDDVFIFTRSGLVGQDQDELLDVYDVRVGGGLASQSQPPPPDPCEGEACKHALSPPPLSPSPGTHAFQGPGNANPSKPKPRCPKGKRRVRRQGKPRCAPKRHQRKADRNRRAGR